MSTANPSLVGAGFASITAIDVNHVVHNVGRWRAALVEAGGVFVEAPVRNVLREPPHIRRPKQLGRRHRQAEQMGVYQCLHSGLLRRSSHTPWSMCRIAFRHRRDGGRRGTGTPFHRRGRSRESCTSPEPRGAVCLSFRLLENGGEGVLGDAHVLREGIEPRCLEEPRVGAVTDEDDFALAEIDALLREAPCAVGVRTRPCDEAVTLQCSED